MKYELIDGETGEVLAEGVTCTRARKIAGEHFATLVAFIVGEGSNDGLLFAYGTPRLRKGRF